jgi:hypothetical protein
MAACLAFWEGQASWASVRSIPAETLGPGGDAVPKHLLRNNFPFWMVNQVQNGHKNAKLLLNKYQGSQAAGDASVDGQRNYRAAGARGMTAQRFG